MAVKKMRALFVVVCLAAVGQCCWAEDEAAAADKMKTWAHGAEEQASQAMHDASQTPDSWAGWAFNKLEGLGLDTDRARNLAQKLLEKTKGAVSQSTESFSSAAYETSRYASEKASDVASEAMQMASDANQMGKDKSHAYDSASEQMGMLMNKASDVVASEAKDKALGACDMASTAKDTASDKAGRAMDMASTAKDTVSDKAGMAMEKASNMASTAKDTVSDKAGRAMETVSDVAGGAGEAVRSKASGAHRTAGDTIEMATYKVGDVEERMGGAVLDGGKKAYDAYEEAKLEVQDTYDAAKDSMSEQAKQKYGAAKEKASQATGDLGAEMSTGTADL